MGTLVRVVSQMAACAPICPKMPDWCLIPALPAGDAFARQLSGNAVMKKYLLVLPLLLATASAPGLATAQVSKNKTGAGFADYGSYRLLNVGPVKNATSKRAGNGKTGSSDVPVYSAKRRGIKIRRLTQKAASSVAITLDATGGIAMSGVPIFVGDVMGYLRIVRYDRHVFGVVDGLRDPIRGSAMSDEQLGASLASQVTRRTGCALNGPPLLQFKPGHLNKLSVPLACQ